MALPVSVVRGGLALAGALLIATFFGIAPAARAQSACANSGLEPTSRNEARIAAAVLCLLNEERAERRLKELEEEGKLLKAARRHSADMVRRRFFAHVSPDGGSLSDRAREARYVPAKGAWRVAENLAWGSGSYGSPRHVVTSWMKSPSHRRNVLDGSLRHAGVGVIDGTPGGRRGATFTLVLGRR